MCPTKGCPGRTVPQGILRAERGHLDARIYPGHPKLIRAEKDARRAEREERRRGETQA